jgi:hypothetical protein
MGPRIALLALLAVPGLSLAGPSTIDDLRLGPRWHGFRIQPGDFNRQLVLAVWLREGEIDRKLLADVVSLAHDEQEKPFRVLIFAHDASRRGELCAALADLGVPYGAPNLTAMGPAPAPDAESLPWAMRFGQNGSLAEEGSLDADRAALTSMRQVLDATPVIDINVPDRVPELARKVAAKEDFPATMVAIQKGMRDAKGRDEGLFGDLFLLDSFVNGYYSERLKLGKRVGDVQPSLALPFFEALARDFKDTTQGETIDTWVDSYRKSKVYADAVTLERGYLAARKGLEAESCCPACREQGFRYFRYDCATCITARGARVKATITRLKKLLKAKYDEKQMPFLVEVKQYLDELSSLGS